ncbi:condensation domain-containing protein, partial [Archangium sp.]|uniref:condensation domain-containing protein n=1 Tax=Archangium sp. TaxID=1872627 RepID=UPI002D5D71F1
TIAGLAPLIAQKQASLSKEKKAPVSADGEWPVREPSQPVLLSFAQQRLWFMDQLTPGDTSFNVPLAARLKGPLEVESLEWSLRELCRRHESLRTTFATVQGQPVQIISPEPRFQLAVVDLSGLSEQEREAEVQRRADEDVAQPFELTKGPLLRVQLLRLAPQEGVLLVALHHIVTDGWSMRLFLKELGALYEAHSRGRPSPLPELPLQYADYAVWQRGWLSGEVLEAQLAYWRKQLSGAPAVLELPTDHPRPAVRSTRGATVTRPMLSPALVQALSGVAQKEGVTLFMLLEAAFHTLLHRYSGQDDISMGAVVVGRTRTETESLIGLFANFLVFRVNFAGEPTFRELLARVREVVLGAYEHQDVPFETLVEELAPERSLSHAALFQAAFDMRDSAGRLPERLADLEFTPLSTRGTTAKLDLSLSMVDQKDGMVGVCEYSTDLFEEQTIQRMLGHLKTLLEGVAANVDQRLSKLPLLEKLEAFRTGSKGSMAPPILATPLAEYVPLSFAQQLAWMPGKHPPEDATDMVPLVFRLEGALDEATLARSLEEMVRRHEVLRTTFPLVDGEWVQRIHATLPVELPVVDLTHLPEASREAEALRQANEALWRPFDMANGPLLRFGLLRRAESAHVLFLGMHHILTDFVSGSVFLDELTVLYGAYREGKPSPLPPVTLQYRDFTLWERQWMQEGGLERLRSYWARKLAHPPAAPRLPYDREPNGDEGFEEATHPFELPVALSDSVRAFCMKEGVTPFLFMLAVFETFLSRCTRQEDILISFAHANRSRAECEKMLGVFANIVLLRGDVSGSQSFRELLRRVRAEFLEDLDHGDMPYVELARLPGLSSHGPRRSPVQVGFAFPNNPAATSIGFADLVATPLDISRRGWAPLDLSLSMAHGPRGFVGMFNYKTRLFEPATIKALQEYFLVLLECVLAAPEQPLQSLPSLPPLSEQVSPKHVLWKTS